MKHSKPPARKELPRTTRKFCPDCCFYIAGVKEANDDGSPRFFYLPGFQFHSNPNGTFQERIGKITPCHCESGLLVALAFSKSDNYSTPQPEQENTPNIGPVYSLMS